MNADFSLPIRLSYLVRLWHEGDGFRALAENVHTGERYAFADLEALFLFMREEAERSLSNEVIGKKFSE
jgi:hypothetical protein